MQNEGGGGRDRESDALLVYVKGELGTFELVRSSGLRLGVGNASERKRIDRAITERDRGSFRARSIVICAVLVKLA